MNEEELKKQIEIINTDLLDKKPKFKVCITLPGVKFQQEFNDLMDLVKKGNLIQITFDMIDWFVNFIIRDIEKKELDEEIEISPTKESSKIKKSKKKISDIIKELLPNKLHDLFKEVPKFLEALNSYFILALFAYIDFFTKSLYDLLVKEYCDKEVNDLFLSLPPKGNPKVRIKIILENLHIISDEKLNELLDNKTWKKTFEKFIKMRNILAHEAPLVKKQALIDNFPTLNNKAKDDFKLELKETKIKNPDFTEEDLNEFSAIIKPCLEMLILLMEIGKECYGYLSIVDFLLNDFIQNRTNSNELKTI